MYYHSVYDPRDTSSTTSKEINEIILKHLLPKYEYILSDSDPLPTFALKLLNTITERNVSFVGVLNKLKLVPKIFEYYTCMNFIIIVGNTRLNIHTVKIVKSIVDYNEIPLEELNKYQIITKTNNLIGHLISSQQDWCLETVLDIIQLILQSTLKRMQKGKEAVSASAISKEPIDITSISNLLMIAEGLSEDRKSVV